MTYYYGESNRRYEEGRHIASGGEGDIFGIVGNNSSVLKIFKDYKKSEKEQKIKVMLKLPVSKDNDSQITWPKDIVYDENKRFAGYVMKKIISTEDLNVLYEYGPSAKYGTSISWTHKIEVAINICIVLDAVHRAGHVCGDLNPNNINVDTATGHVTFVDTDSYNIIDGSKIYRCPVGMPNYIASEVTRKISKEKARNKRLGKNEKITLENASLPTFTRETDNFALAIHIFQLLMNGAHPYQGAVKATAKSSVVASNPSDNIKDGIVPFINPKNSDATIPLYAPKFNSLPTEIQILFEKAFVKGTKKPSERPDAKTWLNALDKLRAQVKQCSNIAQHQYYNELKSCPLCEADRTYNAALSDVSSAYRKQTQFKKPIVQQSTPKQQTRQGMYTSTSTYMSPPPATTYQPKKIRSYRGTNITQSSILKNFAKHNPQNPINLLFFFATAIVVIYTSLKTDEGIAYSIGFVIIPVLMTAYAAPRTQYAVILPVVGIVFNGMAAQLGLTDFEYSWAWAVLLLNAMFILYCYHFNPNQPKSVL